MKEITLYEFRLNLAELVSDYDGLYEMAMRTPDDQLLKMNLYEDFGLDSLDIEEMFTTLCNDCGITDRVFNPLTRFAFHDEQTVENFIDLVNYYLNR